MVDKLSNDEIHEYLKTMEPSEITREFDHRLDEEGRRLLASREEEEQQVQSFLEDFGREFRRRNPPPPNSPRLPKPPAFWQKCLIPNWVLVVLLIVAGTTVLYRQWQEQTAWDGLGVVRGGSSELEGLEEKDKALAHALIERGETLMTGGARSGERKYLRMALVDFLQAYELEPDNRRLLADLAQIYEKLGNMEKAEEFLAKWQEAGE